MIKEIWKDIPDYEGLYQISNIGNIKSLDRITTIVKQESTFKQRFKGRTLKPIRDPYGYLFVNLFKNAKRYNIKIHQLVAMAFLNHIPCGHDIVIDHIDNNKLNNNLRNLQLVTSRYNVSKGKDKTKTSSKFIGVSWDKQHNKWLSQIRINGKNKNLGRFDIESQASKCYQLALSKVL